MIATLRPSVARAFRRAAVPLGWYYAVTLALPLANGAGHAGSGSAGHAFAVLLLPLILIGLGCTIHGVARALLGALQDCGSNWKTRSSWSQRQAFAMRAAPVAIQAGRSDSEDKWVSTQTHRP